MPTTPSWSSPKLLKKFAVGCTLLPAFLAAQPVTTVIQHTADGDLQGIVSGDGLVRAFKGIPYATPPVGQLRWQPPQPIAPWTGVRDATRFGPRAMQNHIWDDMFFFDAGPSEDCLYLNVWAPAKPAAAKLPVMVWIYGGGFIAGGTSEPRQNGADLCQKGVVVVSMGYRVGIFGFYAHPELTAESSRHASGNQGLLDMVAALQWVKKNIADFGGDPDNVTIFGESAGSFAVSTLMASPLAQGLFHKAIGESGAMFGSMRPTRSLAAAQSGGMKFAQDAFGTTSLEKLRALPAQEILDAAMKPGGHDGYGPDVDGWFLPADCPTIFAAAKQAHVPLLAGWNLDEGGADTLFGHDAPTLANYQARAQERFGDKADEFLKAYAATDDAGAKRVAADFGGDLFIGYSTWKWLDAHVATGGQPVYRYHFEQRLPVDANARPGTEPVANHSGEIEYVFQVLWSKRLEFGPDDRQVSATMGSYWTNFAKTGNPNGPGLPAWPQYTKAAGYPVMHLNPDAAALPDSHRDRYEFLEKNGFGRNQGMP
jgi:para-nitrobenzyl esterase